MKKYQVTFVVTEAKVQTVLGVLAREVSDLRMAEVGIEEKKPSRSARSRSSAGPLPVHQTRMGLAMLHGLEGAIDFDKSRAEDILRAAEFNISSTSPCLSALIREGKIQRVSAGKYRVVTK